MLRRLSTASSTAAVARTASGVRVTGALASGGSFIAFGRVERP